MMMAGGWMDRFAGLGQLSDDMRLKLERTGKIVSLPAGTRVYGPGQAPEAYLLLTEGTVRVQQVSESGREIVLYRVAAGESCALTTACLMGYDDYPAEAIAETDVTAMAIPRQTFDEMISGSPEFRRFVFTAFSARVTDLFRLIDEVAFARMDIRLAQRLLELSQGNATVEVTQQRLAAELGSAREVISRLVSELQRRGLVSTGRGAITIVDREKLERLAQDH